MTTIVLTPQHQSSPPIIDLSDPTELHLVSTASECSDLRSFGSPATISSGSSSEDQGSTSEPSRQIDQKEVAPHTATSRIDISKLRLEIAEMKAKSRAHLEQIEHQKDTIYHLTEKVHDLEVRNHDLEMRCRIRFGNIHHTALEDTPTFDMDEFSTS